ncbi:hypothetical protein AB4Z01_19830 [Inquilinus sp. YAF38]|uniref:hypothetical protein n=1 Tax=Inquilinus sp. YAF38 TaxID=3233084 RepID=UPI003F937A57
MPVLSGGNAANDNRPIGTVDWLCLVLTSDVWSRDEPAAEAVGRMNPHRPSAAPPGRGRGIDRLVPTQSRGYCDGSH